MRVKYLHADCLLSDRNVCVNNKQGEAQGSPLGKEEVKSRQCTQVLVMSPVNHALLAGYIKVNKVTQSLLRTSPAIRRMATKQKTITAISGVSISVW